MNPSVVSTFERHWRSSAAGSNGACSDRIEAMEGGVDGGNAVVERGGAGRPRLKLLVRDTDGLLLLPPPLMLRPARKLAPLRPSRLGDDALDGAVAGTSRTEPPLENDLSTGPPDVDEAATLAGGISVMVDATELPSSAATAAATSRLRVDEDGVARRVCGATTEAVVSAVFEGAASVSTPLAPWASR